MFSNRYIQRRVAPTDSRACFVCYKPTCSVMVHENQSDYFYACDTHLNDPGFAVLDAGSQEAERKKHERQAEINELRKKWEERPKQSTPDEKDSADTDKEANANESSNMPTSNAAVSGSSTLKPTAQAPTRKTYELNKGILNLRFNTKRRMIQERRTKALLETPGAFPSVPSHKPQ